AAETTRSVILVVATITALLAATMAMVDRDIKKVLAYSTVSQLGYMFLGVGVGAFTAGFFHVVTHAFFKALLFLGSGSIIHALHHEQDMRRMGGLRKHMKWTFLAFFAAYLAIIGVPGFSGFFSKDEILWLTLATPPEQVALFGPDFPLPTVLWAIGALTALLTAFYMSRLMFMTFWGPFRGHHAPHESGGLMVLPLMVLAVLSVVGGVMNLPHWIHVEGWTGGLHHFLEPVFRNAPVRFDGVDSALELPVMGVTLLGIAASVVLAWVLYVRQPERPAALAARIPALYRGSLNKWYVDEIYVATLLRPILMGSRHILWAVIDVGIIDGLVNGVGNAARRVGAWYGRVVHVGQIQAYALGIAIGTALLVLLFAVGA
ncbi:MAG: proton-conducting transporter membrane subunit, partial [Myxococcota bacterium]|nr:proton-conducting transporter membrane subunit [Myxococcota bacterium]